MQKSLRRTTALALAALVLVVGARITAGSELHDQLLPSFARTSKSDVSTVGDPTLAFALLSDPNLIADPETAVFFAPGARVSKAEVTVPPAGTWLGVGVDPSTKWLRIVSGAGAGQVAAVSEVAAGRVRIGRVFRLPATFSIWLDDLISPPPRSPEQPWFVVPNTGDRVIAVSSSLLLGEAPAFFTVAEILADERLRKFNVDVVGPKLDKMKAGRGSMRFLSLPVIYVLHEGATVQLTPNLADVRIAGGRDILPRPWGPSGPDGRDVFEDATREAFANEELEVTFGEGWRSSATPPPWWTRLRRP